MRSASLITLHLLQGSAVVMGIGILVLLAQGVRLLLSLPRPKPVPVSLTELLYGERR
jgi:hypothetical protein